MDISFKIINVKKILLVIKKSSVKIVHNFFIFPRNFRVKNVQNMVKTVKSVKMALKLIQKWKIVKNVQDNAKYVH